MANIKSAQKRIRVAAKKQARNRHIKSGTKTAIKKVGAAVNAGDSDSKEFLIQAIRTIDKACSKGVFHKNNASRKKSKLTRMVNKAAI